MLKKYKIFGYHVLSEIEIDAFECDSFENPDVYIGFEKIETHEALMDGGFSFSRNEALIQMVVPEVGSFEIQDGSKIKVHPFENAKDSGIQLFLLGSSFGFLMHQRKEFPLHGSAVDLGNGASIILVGHSGAGKSSLASGFVDRGYKLLTDDVARVTAGIEGVTVHPSYPSQKIWKDAVEKLSIDYDENNRILNRVDKFYVNTRERFCSEAKKLQAVVEIFPGDVEAPALEELNGREKLNALIAHSYRQEMMGAHTDLGAHLRWCTALGKEIPFYRIYRPKVGFTVSKQVNVLLEKFLDLK